MGEETIVLDDEVWDALPVGSKAVSAVRSGATSWSVGVKATVELLGEHKSYFVKLYDDPQAEERALCDYESAKVLGDVLGSSNTVPATAHGVLPALKPGVPRAFYIAPFRDLVITEPPMTGLIPLVDKLRKAQSPKGKHGFHVKVFYGWPPLDATWTDTWLEFFTRDWGISVEAARASKHGYGDAELWALALVVEREVIAAILGPLESGDNRIKPTLCHGDMYPNNVQTDAETGETVLFDGCCYYGHWESDLQIVERYPDKMGPDLVERFKKELGPSEPVDMFEDRMALYALRNDFYTLLARKGSDTRIPSMKDGLRALIAKYA